MTFKFINNLSSSYLNGTFKPVSQQNAIYYNIFAKIKSALAKN